MLSNARRMNTSGLPIFALNSTVGRNSTGLLGTSAAVQQAREPLVYRAIHRELLLEIRSAEHAAKRRNDPRLCIRQGQQHLQAADHAADPTARCPVEQWPTATTNRVTNRNNVLVRERRRIYRHRCEPRGASGRIEWRVHRSESPPGRKTCDWAAQSSATAYSAPVPRPGNVRRGPQSRVLVRNDRGSGLSQTLVRTCLLGMPMRVEQRMDGAASRQLRHGVEKRARMARVSAVNHYDAIHACEGQRIGAANARRAQDRRSSERCRLLSVARTRYGPKTATGRATCRLEVS